MLSRLFLLMVLVPFTELYLIFKVHDLVAESVGSFDALIFTFGSIILTGMTGAWFAKREGIAVLGRLQKKAASGEEPGDELIEAVMILVGGILLLTPGYLTDSFGFSLVFPVTRMFFRSKITESVKAAMASGNFSFQTMGGGMRGGFSTGSMNYQNPVSRPIKGYTSSDFSSPSYDPNSENSDVIDVTDFQDHEK